MGQVSNNEESVAFVDAHVHLYPCFDVADLLDHALRNFKAAAAGHYTPGMNGDVIYVMYLTEGCSEGACARLRHICATGGDVDERWTLNETAPGEYWAVCGDDRLLLLSGYQLVSTEGIELLLLDRRLDSVADRSHSLQALIERYADSIMVLPWGAGKWLGRRGRTVSAVLSKNTDGGNLLLGDIGGRPRWWRRVPQFELAREVSVAIISGSDPLPISGECQRVGSYGFRLALPGRGVSGRSHSEQIRSALVAQRSIVAYGTLLSSWRFWLKQFRLRLNFEGSITRT